MSFCHPLHLAVHSLPYALDVSLLVQRSQVQSHGALLDALLFAHLGVEHDVEQHIAQLLTYAVKVFVSDGVYEFKTLLYGVVAQRVEGLFSVPRAFFAQGIHHLQEPCP